MKQKLVFDIECASDYFLVGFMGIESGVVRQYEFYDGCDFNRKEILSILQNFTVIGFNSQDYDIPMLFYALKLAYEVETWQIEVPDALLALKALSDHIIAAGLRGWQTEKEYGFKVPEWIDQIDLKEPVPGVQISLKLYGGRLHSKKLQDLPYDHNEPVFGWPEDRRKVIVDYNVNDLHTTRDLWYEAIKPSDNIIASRERIGAEFGIDMRSKSDAQIAEAVIKSVVSKMKGEPVYRSEIRPGTRYKYQPPAFLKFKTDTLRKVFADVLASDFVVDAKGGIEMPPALMNAKVQVGHSLYSLGIGGLHSNEKCRAVYATDKVTLHDFDVTSFYPSLILQCGLFPVNMGEHFQRVYKDFFNRRLAAKKSGDKSTALTLKIVLNSAYGKLGSKWSVLYAPNLMIQTTLTGQLVLLMLVESLEIEGIPVISGNTDGIVTACPSHLKPRMYEITSAWERDTGMGLEETQYTALVSRSVNSYIAVKPDGEVKTKGDLAKSDAQHNPSNEIVKKAVIDYVAKGTPIIETIFSCRDVRQFLTVTRVTGGAQMPTARKWIDHWQFDGEKWVMQHGNKTYKEKRKSKPAPVMVTEEATYLGKVVRFYHSTRSTSHIENVKTGGKVPTSDNAMPLMELDGTFPDDIDYLYYISEAESLMRDMGVK